MFGGQSGVAMMLSAFGVDLGDVEKKMQGATDEAKRTLAYFKDRLDTIENNQSRILAILEGGSKDGRTAIGSIEDGRGDGNASSDPADDSDGQANVSAAGH